MPTSQPGQMTITGTGTTWYHLDNSWAANPNRVMRVFPSLREAQRALLSEPQTELFDTGTPFSTLSSVLTV